MKSSVWWEFGGKSEDLLPSWSAPRQPHFRTATEQEPMIWKPLSCDGKVGRGAILQRDPAYGWQQNNKNGRR
jgi:hypothetical protein